MVRLRAQPLPAPVLETRPKHKLCCNFLVGRCEKEDCQESHEVVFVEGGWHTPETSTSNQPKNYLRQELRKKHLGEGKFDDNGPGHLSKDGPRHDNDHADIRKIRILPTTDEVS